MNKADKNKKRVTIFLEPWIVERIKARAKVSRTSMTSFLYLATLAIAEDKISFLGWNLVVDGKHIPLSPTENGTPVVVEEEPMVEPPAPDEDTSSWPNITVRQYAERTWLESHDMLTFTEPRRLEHYAQVIAEETHTNRDSCIRALKEFPRCKEGNPGWLSIRRALGLEPMSHPGVKPPNLDREL